MFDGHDDFEVATLYNMIRSYERMTGFSAGQIRHDASSIWIEWIYPDNKGWAGTMCCDMPLHNAIFKLEREIESERLQIMAARAVA